MEFSWRDCSLHNRLSPRFRTPRSKRSQRAVICVTQSKITWSVRTCGPRSFDQKTRAAKSADRARAKNTPQGRAAPNPLRETHSLAQCTRNAKSNPALKHTLLALKHPLVHTHASPHPSVSTAGLTCVLCLHEPADRVTWSSKCSQTITCSTAVWGVVHARSALPAPAV